MKTLRWALVAILVLASAGGVFSAPTRQAPGGTSGPAAGQSLTATRIILPGGTVTTSSPLVDGSQTWNAGGVTFAGLLINVTDTASAAASMLLQLQRGAANQFTVTKTGTVTATGNLTIATGGTINAHTVPNISADTFTLNAAAQTLTNKTLTAPTISGGTISSATLSSPTLSSPTITGTAVGISAVLNAATSTIDVVNTVTETDLYNFTVPANTLGTANALRFVLIGDYLNNSGAGATLQVRIYFGATLWVSGGARTTGAAANRKLFTVAADLHAKGATNAQVALGRWSVSDEAATGGIGTWQVDANAVGTMLPNIGAATTLALDSTATQVFRVSVIHSVANANISVRLLSARLEILR